MKLTAIKNLFETSYGNKFDLNKMEIVESSDETTVNFIARTSKNLGVSAIVKRLDKVEPNEEGLITVALGGAILASFVQPEKFYTAQNIMILQPKREMTFQEKVFYCVCIEKNKNRYSTFGREANRTLKDLLIPEKAPNWLSEIDIKNLQRQLITQSLNLLIKR